MLLASTQRLTMRATSESYFRLAEFQVEPPSSSLLLDYVIKNITDGFVGVETDKAAEGMISHPSIPIDLLDGASLTKEAGNYIHSVVSTADPHIVICQIDPGEHNLHSYK